jgi:spore coat polysaccharide biosynthesis protein SpsF
MANKNKIVAIIQARIHSSRLPNKMFLNLHGHPICEWVYRRVKMSKKIDQLVFALPDTEGNNTFAWYLKSIGADVFRGSESDVVERFYLAANYSSASTIVRICADNPLICSSEIDRLIDFFQKNTCDYAYNHIPKNNKYPDGLGAEICSMNVLKIINQNAKKNNHREHLFNYIWSNPSEISIKTFDPLEELAYPHLKLDIDTMSDYQFLLENEFRIQMSANEVVKLANKISNSLELK